MGGARPEAGDVQRDGVGGLLDLDHDPIAHGFLTLSLMPKLIKIPVELSGMKNVVNFGSGGLQFRSPVPAGATLHARSRLVGAEGHKAGTKLTFDSSIHMKGSEKPSLVYTSILLFQG